MPLVPSRWLCAAAAALLGGLAAAQPPPPPDRPAAPPTQPPAPPPPTVAATVNGEVIRLDEVDAVIRGRRAAAPITANQVRRLRLAVLADLIDDRLVDQHLKANGPAVEPAEVDRHFQALAVALRRQGKTPDQFFKESGLTEAQARDHWTALIRFQKYVDSRATDDALRKYFEANRDVFDGSTVRAAHIVVRVGPTAPPADRATAHARLDAVRADLLAGKITFADAARKYSEDPSAAAGGDVGFVGRRDAAAEEAFTRAAFALKPGEVSDPTDTEYGVHLITVAERKAGTPAAFDRVIDLVRECYADDLRAELVAALRKQGQIQVTVP